MILSRTVQMAQTLVEETLDLTRKGRSDAADEGFKTDVFPWVVNGQIEKNLQHLQMLMEGIAEDASVIERKMKDRRVTDDYDLDTDSGKPVGRQFDVNGREIR